MQAHEYYSVESADRSRNLCAVRGPQGEFAGLFVDDFIVNSAVTNAGLASPWVDLRTRLARPHVADATLVPKVTYLGVVAFLGFFLRK